MMKRLQMIYMVLFLVSGAPIVLAALPAVDQKDSSANACGVLAAKVATGQLKSSQSKANDKQDLYGSLYRECASSSEGKRAISRLGLRPPGSKNDNRALVACNITCDVYDAKTGELVKSFKMSPDDLESLAGLLEFQNGAVLNGQIHKITITP
jgi:hypothetical protein